MLVYTAWLLFLIFVAFWLSITMASFLRANRRAREYRENKAKKKKK